MLKYSWHYGPCRLFVSTGVYDKIATTSSCAINNLFPISGRALPAVNNLGAYTPRENRLAFFLIFTRKESANLSKEPRRICGETFSPHDFRFVHRRINSCAKWTLVRTRMDVAIRDMIMYSTALKRSTTSRDRFERLRCPILNNILTGYPTTLTCRKCHDTANTHEDIKNTCLCILNDLRPFTSE